jgi:hypothetical protein
MQGQPGGAALMADLMAEAATIRTADGIAGGVSGSAAPPDSVAAAGMTLARCDDPEPLQVGVTGHRVLAETERVEAGIEAAIARIEASHPGRSLVVVSALAEGADRLVAAAVLRRPGARLWAVLPLPKADLLDDFATLDSKEEFLRLLARADEVTELPAQAGRAEAFAAANDLLLDRIDLLVAVWDGRGVQGQAGTADVVTRARVRGLPVARIHAGNRKPGTMEPASLGTDQGRVTYENL